MNSPPRARVYGLAWLALMGLLALTFGVAHLPLGAFNAALGLAIAAAKVALVAAYFMHLRRSSALVVLFALVALVALAVLFGLGAADYANRAIHPAPWGPPR